MESVLPRPHTLAKTGTVSFPPTSASSEMGLKPQLPTVAAPPPGGGGRGMGEGTGQPGHLLACSDHKSHVAP